MAKGKMLDKTAFLRQSSNLRKVVCELPELGGSVYVRELSGKALLEYNERIKQLGGDGGEVTPAKSVELMCLMASLTVVDENGDLMFTEQEAMQLANGSLSVLLAISKKAMEVSGISPEAIAEVADSLKNAPTSASTAS